jgi:hypothetical protein
MEEGMSKFDRRHMLKIMAATAGGAAAAGAAVGRAGIESVLAASPAPGGGPIQGTQASSPAASAPLSLATTPFTTYQGVPGYDFDAGGSGYTWFVTGGAKFPTNGGFYSRRLMLPQASVLTECIFYLVNPTTPVVNCYILSATLGTNSLNIISFAGTSGTHASVQPLTLTVSPPTFIDNTSFWYGLDIENGAATDNQIWGARIGYLNNPGLNLFPNPRRVVDGFATPFTSGITYGPFDATHQVYPIAAASGVPVGATAAFCAVQSYTAGVLTIFPDLTTDTNLANFSATADGPLSLTYMMVPLSPAGKFKIHSYITGHVSVDAWGYVV